MEKYEILWMINDIVLRIMVSRSCMLPENRCAKLRPPLEFELVAATALHRLIVYSTSSESSREQSEAGQPGPGPARCIVFIPLSPGIILNEISNSELNLLTIRSAGFYDRKLFTLCKYNFANVKTCFNLRLQLLHSGCEPLT